MNSFKLETSFNLWINQNHYLITGCLKNDDKGRGYRHRRWSYQYILSTFCTGFYQISNTTPHNTKTVKHNSMDWKLEYKSPFHSDSLLLLRLIAHKLRWDILTILLSLNAAHYINSTERRTVEVYQSYNFLKHLRPLSWIDFICSPDSISWNNNKESPDGGGKIANCISVWAKLLICSG